MFPSKFAIGWYATCPGKHRRNHLDRSEHMSETITPCERPGVNTAVDIVKNLGTSRFDA